MDPELEAAEELARQAGHDRSNPSGLPEDHPDRQAARERAQTFKAGDVPLHHGDPEEFPGAPA